MQRRELLKALPALAVTAPVTKMLGQAHQTIPPVYSTPAKLPPYKGRLRPGVVAMSFRNQLETGKMTYEDAVRAISDLGLEGMDMTGYCVSPLLQFKPGIPSQVISERVRQNPANPSGQWLASLRRTAYKNAVQIYSVGAPVKMAQPTPELRQREIAFAKKWIAIAYWLGAGHVRIFAGSIPKGATEEQAVDWAIEVYRPALEYAGNKGLVLGVEDDDELTRTSAQPLAIMKKADSPYARINIDCGNFRKNGYAEVAAVAPYAGATHIKSNMSMPDGKREPGNWVKLFGILADAGYRGFVLIEMEPNGQGNPVSRYAPELIRCARMYSGAA